MDDYKAVMELLDRIGAFEEKNRPHLAKRALEIAKDIGLAELQSAQDREQRKRIKRVQAPVRAPAPGKVNSRLADLPNVNPRRASVNLS